ncbi:ABC transporter substrate-binding protein [Oceanimonas doudoroffii]|uniref:Oligopeptide ABC transporter substrate-binding protein OppA n=1 Tax=Oceanimonas doudoroffii TaxID=84158 RepID=A0A233RK21_9GAMM|nr:ABC transporter substrate-binding protein [Oceanimonas doudoroffii]OXY83734.1 oligopeptide ABC transporter substrate-binding protein OppA [Oceanimonas doudoroffii]
MTIIHPLLVLLLAALCGPAHAADVPIGVTLADTQRLVRGNGTEPASLDPHKVEGVPEGNVLRDLFEGLVNSGPQGEVVPGVAERWETKDNLVYVFHLRKDARWSNGDLVTAADFVYAFRRAVDPATASPYSWYLEKATIQQATEVVNGRLPPEELGVKALNEHTLEITLASPVPYFVSMLSLAPTYPVHRGTLEQHGDTWTRVGNMVSNGAYRLSNWVVNERIELKRNPHYWNDEHTVLDEVAYLPIASQNAEMNRFLSGELDMTYDIPLEHFKRLRQERPDAIRVGGYVGTYYYIFNTRKPPFNDARIRKALSYAIDRDIIAGKVMGQGELPAYTLAPRVVDGFTPPALDWAGWSQTERNERARSLIEQAGYGRGNPLRFELLYNTSENHRKVAVAIASMWKKHLGVEVELVNQEWKTYLDTKTQGNFDVARAGWIADYNEASSMLDLMQSSHGNNDGKYSNPGFDRLMSRSRLATDVQARNDLYARAEEMLAVDMPLAPIYQYVKARLVQPRVGGYPNNPLDNIYSKDMYIKAE